LRLLVLGVALVLNLGFYLPRVSGVPGAGVPGADKIAHVVVFALTVWAAGRVLAPLSRFPMGGVVIADRKSTRLNSSHVAISYPPRSLPSFPTRRSSDLCGCSCWASPWCSTWGSTCRASPASPVPASREQTRSPTWSCSP